MKNSLVALLALFVLNGCGSEPEAEPKPATVQWQTAVLMRDRDQQPASCLLTSGEDVPAAAERAKRRALEEGSLPATATIEDDCSGLAGQWITATCTMRSNFRGSTVTNELRLTERSEMLEPECLRGGGEWQAR